MNKLVKVSIRHGNLYRFRYYVDGKRVSRASLEGLEPGSKIAGIRTSYGYRDEWLIA